MEKRTHVLVAGHDLKFTGSIREYLQTQNGFEIQVDEWPGHQAHDVASSEEKLAWADVIWAEWCLGNAVWYVKHLQPRQRLLIRLHLQELRTPYPEQVDSNRVSQFVFNSPYILGETQARYGVPTEKMRVIPNAIEFQSFNKPKVYGAEFNLGLLGMCPWRKRPDLAFEILERLRRVDNRYTLYVKGQLPIGYEWLWKREEERRAYLSFFAHINHSPSRNAVAFDPWGDDVPVWFQKVGVILSTSDFEGSHYAVGEGMASGAATIIFGWQGAQEQYPTAIIVQSVEEAVERILELRQREHRLSLMETGKRFIQEHMDLPIIGKQWADLIHETQISS